MKAEKIKIEIVPLNNLNPLRTDKSEGVGKHL